MKWWAGLLLVLILPLFVSAFGEEEPCDYYPACALGDQGTGGCDACSAPRYPTACDGYCDTSATPSCEYLGSCTPGQQTGIGCAANETKTCTASCTYGSCVCIENTITKSTCTGNLRKVCRGGSWSDCEQDCTNPQQTCNSPPVCKTNTNNDVCKPTYCNYANAAYGTDCGSSTFVCNSVGSCSVPKCGTAPNQVCRSSVGNATINSTAYCATGSCFQCDSGYTYNSASGTCLAGCPPNAKQCSGAILQTCTLQGNNYVWVDTSCSPGTCTVSPPPAQCCTPDSQATTCGTNNCGTKTNNCGQSISCGTCTTS